MTQHTKIQVNQFNAWRFMLFMIAPVLVVYAIWLPFGLALTGLIEEWGILGLFTTHGVFFISDIQSPLQAHALRPLTVLPHALAYFLDPNSFDYWHVSLICSLILKGSAASYLMWKATGVRSWAILLGILVLIYPADTMQLSFRGLHINWSLSFLLLASAIFIIAYENTRPLRVFILSFIAALTLFVSICMYEGSVLLIFLPFLVLWVRTGFKMIPRTLGSHALPLIMWILSVGLYLGYFALISHKIVSYQQSVIGDRSILTILHASLSKLFSVGVFRSLIGGWFDAARMFISEFSFDGYAYLLIATSVLFAIYWLTIKTIDEKGIEISHDTMISISLRLFCAGFLLLCLGYSPFLLSGAHLLISQRTFLFASLGAAMFWVALLMLIACWQRWLAQCLIFGLIYLGLAAQLVQFHHYVQISETQRNLLKNIVKNFKGDLAGKTLLILDESNQLNRTWMFLNGNLAAALTYFYNKPIHAIEVCYMPSKEWQHDDDLARHGVCIENKNDWTFHYPIPVNGPGYQKPSPKPDIKLAKNKIVLMRICPDGSISPDPALEKYRQHLDESVDPLAQRYRHILARTVPHNKFWATDPTRYQWHFGHWWSMELPIKGSGWREAEWQVHWLHHYAQAFKSQEKSSLLFDLTPAENKQYMIRGQFSMFISPLIQKSIQISVNQKNIAFQWLDGGTFVAKIKPNVLRTGINTIAFNSHIDPDYFGLSAKLSWFEVYPQNNNS